MSSALEIANEVKKAMSEFFQSETFHNIIGDAVSKAVDGKVNKMELEIKELKENNEKLENKLNDLEQYGRRNNIRIYGINKGRSMKIETNELEKEVVRQLNEKTGCALVNHQIEACHYLDKSQNQVIVRFVSRKTRDEVFYRKKGFRGTKVSVTEDLTSKNYHLLKECQNHFDKKFLWTKYGMVKLNLNGKIYNVRTMKDVENLNK